MIARFGFSPVMMGGWWNVELFRCSACFVVVSQSFMLAEKKKCLICPALSPFIKNKSTSLSSVTEKENLR